MNVQPPVTKASVSITPASRAAHRPSPLVIPGSRWSVPPPPRSSQPLAAGDHKLVRSPALLVPPRISMREWVARGVAQGRLGLAPSGLAVRAGDGKSATPPLPETPSETPPLSPLRSAPQSPPTSQTPSPVRPAGGGPGFVMHTGAGVPSEVVSAIGAWLMGACSEDASDTIESLASAVTRALKGHLSLEAGLRESVLERLRAQDPGLPVDTVGALFAGLLRGLADPGSRASIFRLVRLLAHACEGGRLGAAHAGAAVAGLARVLSVRNSAPKWADLVDCLLHFRLPAPAWAAAVRALAEAAGGPDMPASHRVPLRAAIERRAATHGADWGRAGLLGLRLGTGDVPVPAKPAAPQCPRPPG